MAGRIRTVKPEVFEDGETGTLSDAAFRLYVGMTAQADDWGNLRAVVAQLGGFVFWAQKKAPDVGALLQELERRGVIRRYEVDGLPYASIVGWNELGHPRYQAVDKKSRTRRVPAPVTEAQPFLPIVGSRETLASDSRDPREGGASASRVSRYPQATPSSGEGIRSGSDPKGTDLDPDPDAPRAHAIPVLVPRAPESLPVDANGYVTPEGIREESARAVASLRGRTSL